MKILILGKNGQIARNLASSLLSYEIKSLGRAELAFNDPSIIKNVIINYRPEVIINAVAYTEVDKAQEEQEMAYLVNFTAVQVITEAANQINACLVHYSSDYVFDGSKKTPYAENDQVNPLNFYGETKAMADIYIAKNCKKYLIFRLSAIFDYYGKNFPNIILNLLQNQNSIKVINDQFIIPCSAIFVAKITKQILDKIKTNNNFPINETYHLSPSGRAVSWFKFAKMIEKKARNSGFKLLCKAENILPVSTFKYNQKASRPHYSQLSNQKIEKELGYILPLWNSHFNDFIKKISKDNA